MFLPRRGLQLSARTPGEHRGWSKQPQLSLVSWVLGAEAGQASQGIYHQTGEPQGSRATIMIKLG